MTAERPRARGFAKGREMSFFIVISDIFLAASAAMLAMIVIMKAAEPRKSLVTTNLDLHCRTEGEGVLLSTARAANGPEGVLSYPSLEALLNSEKPSADLMLVVGLVSGSDAGCYLEVARQADALNLQKNKREGIGPLVSLKPVQASGAEQ
jgi:hypothetical protein